MKSSECRREGDRRRHSGIHFRGADVLPLGCLAVREPGGARDHEVEAATPGVKRSWDVVIPEEALQEGSDQGNVRWNQLATGLLSSNTVRGKDKKAPHGLLIHRVDAVFGATREVDAELLLDGAQ